MNTKRVWILVIVVIILELWFVVWVEVGLRYRESRYEYVPTAPSVPFIWYSTDQS